MSTTSPTSVAASAEATITYRKPFSIDDQLLCAADQPAQPIEWLWQDRIPIGKVTLLAGDPGTGKSLLALDLAARVTRGEAFPSTPSTSPFASSATTNSSLPPSTLPPPPSDIPPGAASHSGSRLSTLDSRPPASVLILSASDDFADTIRPRLDVAGADPARIFTLPLITDLRHDLNLLKAALDRIPNCRLIIVDPVNAFVGPGDSHYHTVVRRVLTPLTRLAAERRIAIIAVTQFRKNDGAAIHRAAGSTGFVATARSLWTVCRDPRDSTRNLFLPIKQNLTRDAAGLAFRIVADGDSQAPRIVWEPETPVPSIEEAVRRPQPSKSQPPQPPPERAAARAWLQEILARGPRPARGILAEGAQYGFLERTLQRAFHELGGRTAKQGLVAGWWWALEKEGPPPETIAAGEPAPAENHAPQSDTPQKTPDAFEGVTYDHDVASLNQLDALVVENLTRYLHQPTVKESIAAIKRADSIVKELNEPPEPAPDPNSPTGHPILDELLENFRASAQSPSADEHQPDTVPTPSFSGGACSALPCSALLDPDVAPPNPHPTPATRAAAKVRQRKFHSHGNTTRSPAPPPPVRPSHAPGSFVDSS